MSLTPKQQEDMNKVTRELWKHMNDLIEGSQLLQDLLGIEIKDKEDIDGSDS